MKPCVCQGSNENCRYSAGLGYVRDGGQPPSPPDDLKKWIPESVSVDTSDRPKVARPEKQGHSSFFSEMRGCLLWGLLAPILLFLLLKLLLGK